MISHDQLERWKALADALPAWTRTPDGDLQSPPHVHPQVLSDDELDALAEKVAIIVFAREAVPALIAEVKQLRSKDVLGPVLTKLREELGPHLGAGGGFCEILDGITGLREKVEAQAKEIERLRAALTNIAAGGCASPEPCATHGKGALWCDACVAQAALKETP